LIHSGAPGWLIDGSGLSTLKKARLVIQTALTGGEAGHALRLGAATPGLRPEAAGGASADESRLEERLTRLRLEHLEIDPLPLAPPERLILGSHDQTRASPPALAPGITPGEVTKPAVELAAVTGPTLASDVSVDLPEGSVALSTAPLGAAVMPGFTLFLSTSPSRTIADAGSVSVVEVSSPAPPSRMITLSTLAMEPVILGAGRDEGSCFQLETANLTENVLLPILGAIGGIPVPLDPQETSVSATITGLPIGPEARGSDAAASDVPLTATAVLDADSCSRFMARSWLPAAGFGAGPLCHLAGLNGFGDALSRAPGDQAPPRTLVITVTPALKTGAPSNPSSSTRSE
jgi:hypothetical protein